jgi:hypothetical protein
MKLKSIIGSTLLAISALTFVSAPASYAGECSAEDPCHTYAMVDDSGVVTNIIVCQPSVCGGGTFAGSRVVPQVAANPVTHQSQGGYFANQDSTPVRENNGVFTITNDNPTVTSNVTQNATNTEVVSTSFEAGVKQSFTFNDTVGQPGGRPVMRTEPMNNSIGATLSYSKIRNSESATAVSGESITFDERQTEEYVELELMIQELTKLLANWNWFRTSLFGWFL